jgi:hypothetical protein
MLLEPLIELLPHLIMHCSPKICKLEALANCLQGTNIKKKVIANYPISVHKVFIMGLISNCPDKSVDFQNGRTMKEIRYQNDIDRPGPNNALSQEILEAFEDHLLDCSDKCHVIAPLKLS